MATKAYHGKDRALLMPGTAEAYYSAFKSYLVWKFEDEGIPKPFEQSRWTRYRRSMRKQKFAIHNESGEAMMNPKRMISDKQRKGLATICIWNGDPRSATFYALNGSLYHHAAR